MNTEPAPDVVARIDALLPQTQCTRCGYAGCKPYAAAIASGEAEINQCPPGGGATIAALAATSRSARACLESGPTAWKPRRVSPGSMSHAVSAAHAASRPARWTPSSAPQSTCTPFLPSAARAASCACRPARSIASKCGRRPAPAGESAGAQSHALRGARCAPARIGRRNGSGNSTPRRLAAARRSRSSR